MSGFTVAKYLRLSSEDADLNKTEKLESNSISNQRNLLDSFISRTPDFSGAAVTEFCDDGWSGKNFERPAFQEMIAQVQQGKIQCIIVKDMSRFGRDYLVVGNYISRVFPFLGVRFIAVNDGFDSIRQADIDSLDTSFKALLYDLYSRDLSRKVRSALFFRAKRGDYVAAFAPYGYKKDPDNKHHLIVDPPAAKIVRRIFQMVGSGQTTLQTAKVLNTEAVPTPMCYKKDAGSSLRIKSCIHDVNFWTADIIIRIIRNECYLGKVIYGRSFHDIIGSNHYIRNKRSDWIVVAAQHQGIVTQEEFDRAQSAIRVFMEHGKRSGNPRILSGKVRCGVCGHIMFCARKKQTYYLCRTPRVTNQYDCPREKVLEQDILDAVSEGVRARASVAVEMAQIVSESQKIEQTDTHSRQKALLKMKERLEKQERQIRGLYEAFALGEISKEEYLFSKAAATNQREETAEQIARLEAELADINFENPSSNGFVTNFQKYSEIEEITAELAAEVLQEILIYPEQRIEIKWRYQEDFEQFILGKHKE